MIIIIDGYNFMNASAHFGEFAEIEKNRKRIIDSLVRYHEIKGHPIILVFDAYKSGGVHETREGTGKIEVIYTRLGETADEKIIDFAKIHREKALIITADKEIIKKSESFGSSTLSSEEFTAKLLQTTLMEDMPFGKEEDEEENNPFKKHRGNPRKPSKKERIKLKKIKKL